MRTTAANFSYLYLELNADYEISQKKIFKCISKYNLIRIERMDLSIHNEVCIFPQYVTPMGEVTKFTSRRRRLGTRFPLIAVETTTQAMSSNFIFSSYIKRYLFAFLHVPAIAEIKSHKIVIIILVLWHQSLPIPVYLIKTESPYTLCTGRKIRSHIFGFPPFL